MTDVEEAAAPDEAELVAIHLLELPVQIWRQTNEHGDEVQREMQLIAFAHQGDEDTHVPTRLMRLVDRLTHEYAAFSQEQTDRLETAAASGADTIDLEYELPKSIRQAALDLEVMLDEVDEFCRQGEHLLTLATPPEPKAFRDWFLSEFVRQIDGNAPTPWPQWRAAHPPPSR